MENASTLFTVIRGVKKIFKMARSCKAGISNQHKENLTSDYTQDRYQSS